MRSRISRLLVLSLVSSTAFGAPAFSQVPTAYHQGIVAPAICNEPNAVAWTSYNGHHALNINHSVDYAELGFIVFGNRNAVLHGQIPQTWANSGPLPIGSFSFQIAIAQPTSAEPYINAELEYPDGSVGFPLDHFSITNGQTVHIPLTKSSGMYPAAMFVYFDSGTGGEDPGSPDSPFHVVVGNFLINGIAIPGSLDRLTPNSDGVEYCE